MIVRNKNNYVKLISNLVEEATKDQTKPDYNFEKVV